MKQRLKKILSFFMVLSLLLISGQTIITSYADNSIEVSYKRVFPNQDPAPENACVLPVDAVYPEYREIKIVATPSNYYEFSGWEHQGGSISEDPDDKRKATITVGGSSKAPEKMYVKAVLAKKLTITVKDQTYPYDGQPHGEPDPVYDDPAVISEKVTVNGLLETDELTMVELDGEETEIGEYPDRIEVTGFSINNDPGAKDKYEVTLVPGKLIIKKEEPPVPPTHVHSLTVVMAKPATCEESGNKSYYTCSICGKWFEDDTALVEITDKSSVIVKALGHKWDSGVVTKAPTATKDGIRTYTCLRDSSHTKTELIPRRERGHSNHDEPEVTFAPIEDAWLMDGAGWHYRENGVLVKNAWRILRYNGKSYWYLFDENGTMKTGWAEWKGERYYLSPVSDGWMGHMLTGWQEIDGKWYYFETAEGSTQGRMYRNEKTPDGRFVGEDGALIEGA